MSQSRHRWRLLAIWLVIAGVLYRGLIPAGFMPADGAAARHGALLMICPHGEMGMHGHGGNAPGGAAPEQCPFGAAAGPALPGIELAFSFAQGPPQFLSDWRAVPNHGAAPRLQPPPRGPPALS